MFVFSGQYITKAGVRFVLAGLICASFCLSFSKSVRAQDDVLRTDTSLVQLNVGVVDRQGRAITSLSQGDFAIYEDDVKRPIVAFEPTQAPFSLVMLLDMSGSTNSFRQQIKQAAVRFLDALAPEDRVAVISFNGKGVHKLLGFTTDRQRTGYAILELADGAGATKFYDGLDYSLKELSRETKRRKAIVVLTDGIDTELRKSDTEALAKAVTQAEIISVIKPESHPQLRSVLDQADRQGVTIFPLALPSGDPSRLPLPDPVINAKYVAARTRLQMLADRTGGQVSDIRRLDQMARVYAELAAHLRTLYSIAYQAPNPNKRDGQWRAIRVDVTRPDLIAKTKTGYYAK